MERVWHGRGFTRPFLWLGAKRHILLPSEGTDVGFRIDNYAYRDSLGRETVTFVRTFDFGVPRRWDATMIYSPERGLVVDYLGTHQHVAVDLHLSVDDRGALLIRSGEQRFHEGQLSCRIPPLVTGAAEVRESYDDDLGRFRIDVRVVNHRFGVDRTGANQAAAAIAQLGALVEVIEDLGPAARRVLRARLRKAADPA